MRRTWIFGVSVVFILTLSACATSRTYVNERYDDWQAQSLPPSSERAYRVFLIGDAGGASSDPLEPALGLLKSHLDQAGERAAVVFLGDNLYCCGLSDSGAVRRQIDEQRLRAQLEAVKDFEGRIVFLPGNHDWNNDLPGGLEALARQERFVEDFLGRGNVFLPDDGFPGPTEVELTDRLTLIVLDTAWWIYEQDKSFGDTGEYDLEEDADFLLELDDLVKGNDDKDLLVVGHHPLFSNGPHAGILPLSTHLFPLRKVHPALVIPLPLIGSIYPLFTRFNGGRQNLSHPRYRSLRIALSRIFAEHEALIYAAGHDHALQYFPVLQHFPVKASLVQHHIVSGAGSRSSEVGRGRGAAFTAGTEGFAELHYFHDGAIWLEMWGATGGVSGRLLFRTELKGPTRDLVDPEVPEMIKAVDYRDSTVVVAAGRRYEAGRLKQLFLGSHHRKAWTTPVEVPVLDLSTEAGGLTPIKRGGGQQTISLRLEGGDGHQYVLRSIDKDPSGAVPINLQGTVATDVAQDLISSIHPYGAFIIPALADAAGIYHTNPKAVYVPHDEHLGVYQDLFAGKMAMLEERPNDDMSHRQSFGRSKEVVSAPRLYREITNDNDHRIDPRFFARSRLFDMWISDWDRHEDQWRWASFEPYELYPSLTGQDRTEGKIYRPIPRDRDWAFNKMNGILPWIASKIEPKFQSFTENYSNIRGLNSNGFRQDRRFVSPLSRSDFVEIADSLRAALTDEVIDAAVRQWPDPIYALSGEETARLLKIRRDKLTGVAEDFYEIHARVVDVLGSNKHEHFEITRLDDDATRVVVYKTTKKGEKRREIYRRVFLEKETKEIRLYGLDGNDTFVVEGEVGHGILIRAIGGAGADTFVDHSRVRGGSKKTKFYDTETGNHWDIGSETKLIRSDVDPAVNYYDRYGYQPHLTSPIVFVDHNKDDGITIGGGLHVTRFGFRKAPYAASHKIEADVTTRTHAFQAVYEGHYVEVLGHWDVMIDAFYLGPNNTRNFYGLGNQTKNENDDRAFYQARLRQIRLAPRLYTRFVQGVAFHIGPTFQLNDFDETTNRFVNQPQAGLSENAFEVQTFTGLDIEVILDTRDSAINPTLGFHWTNQGQLNIGLRNAEDTFLRLATDLSFYLSPSLRSPQITLAVRIGAAHNISDFPFYSANTLGGKNNLRGHRSARFSGRTSFYQNVALRLDLITFSKYPAPGRLGIMAFLDNGRVWTEEDDDLGVSQSFFEGYHQGYGGGLWTELFDLFVLTATAGFSNDDQTFRLKLGFQY